ncbi:accessory Sec system protein Asp1 [Liquorilactobacillus capillatus]|uniref:Accessory secretory protein asp1 n=1 Tax=Liquorilactobacillus capillatus DSM 19910 TaxID=1423731 RepID=A0A0R1MCB7_9LACO|nr:accessory Sec system protein Asp1 [Liquorilactobacillus capillatus]KRL01000.1 accessory secretory protein asp1 [Liquorilactobacillus capillatus DSM 19910]
MYYFLPSWHTNNKYEWNSSALPWYRNNKGIEFDDTISQLRMFNRTQEKSKTLILEYSPNLRGFLHRQDIYEIDYYSIFDDIQNISDTQMRPFDFMELNWPSGTDFSYTPFLVLARYKGEVIARIEFDSIGALLRIDLLENGKITRRLIFDDRGFLSSVIYFDKQECESYQKFLDLTGRWRICINYISTKPQVEVNSEFKEEFKHSCYKNIEDLIFEKFQSFLDNKTYQDDVLVIAAEEKRNDLLLEARYDIKIILSFFSDRYPIKDTNSLRQILAKADSCVTDTDYTNTEVKEIIAKKGCANKNIEQITPFDSRLRLGKSQRIRELKIFWLIEGLTQPEMRIVLRQLLLLMKADKRIELTVAAYSEYEMSTETFAQIANETIAKNGLAEYFTFNSENLTKSDSELNEIDKKSKKNICWQTIYVEDDIIKEVSDVRLIIDLSMQPNLFLQIAGISAGVPQINIVKTSYVEDHKNGLIIDQLDGLSEAVDYYLEGLAHWNNALMYAATKISEYSSSNLIKKWKQITGRNGKNSTQTNQGTTNRHSKLG